LKDLDNIVAYLGPFCGSPIQIAAQFSGDNSLIGITPNNNYGKLDENFFSIMGLVELEDKVLAEYAFTDLSLNKVGILYFDNHFGVLHKEGFTKYFEKLGGEITITEAFDFTTENDLRTQLLKIGQSSDGVFIVTSKPGEIMNQIAELGLELQILGQWGMQNPVTLNVAGENADGTVYAFPEVVATSEFKAKFMELHGDQPSLTSSSSYDSLHILDYLFTECESFDTGCAVTKMKNLNFEGVSGTINFNPENWDTGKNYVIKTVRNGEFIRLK